MTDNNSSNVAHDKWATLPNKVKTKHKIIDFRKALDPDNDIYVCENCDVRLIPYFDKKGEYLTAPGGKLFQCGRCGQIKDTSAGKFDMKRPEQLTTRGDNADNLFVTHWRQPPKPTKPQQFDIDPGDDLTYKAMGFHIVRTRISLGGRILRDDYDNDGNRSITYY